MSDLGDIESTLSEIERLLVRILDVLQGIEANTG
jgi:hypothetical protein